MAEVLNFTIPTTGAKASLTVWGDGRATLSDVFVPLRQRGKGFGKAVVKRALTYADEHNLEVVLQVEPFGRKALSLDALVSFYEAFGFVAVEIGEPAFMARPRS